MSVLPLGGASERERGGKINFEKKLREGKSFCVFQDELLA
jgi:hypothetical protein